MHIILHFTAIISLVLSLFCSQSVAAKCHNKGLFNTHNHRKHMLNNYLDLWNGDLSLLQSTFSPIISVHADRFPSSTGVGSVPLELNTSEGFGNFVERSRNGWDKYTFVAYKWAGEGNRIAVRWRLEAIMGANFTLIPTTLKQGDPVTYNGTEFLILNQCTGLIDEVDIAQDLITLFHNLGLTAITV